MREQLGLARCWYMGTGSSWQEQNFAQHRAEQEFEFFCSQARLLGFTVEPIKRSWRITNDEAGRPWMATYIQRAYVDGPEEFMQTLKEIFSHERQPIFAELLEQGGKPS
jgi:hypothetical protein